MFSVKVLIRMKTTLARKEDHAPRWYVIDAKGQRLGHLATKIANVLRGRNHPLYTPHVDTGDCVVVINAQSVALSGRKETQKDYMFFTGYVGNAYRRTFSELREEKPRFVIEHAVKGMLPKNKLSRRILEKLYVYPKEEHPHQAQKPVLLEV